MSKLIAAWTFVLAASSLLAATPSTGSCWNQSEAISVGSTKTVAMVKEFDVWDNRYPPDDEADYGYYLKFTVQRGKGYTLLVKSVREDPLVSVSSVDDKNQFNPNYDISSEEGYTWPGFSSDFDPDGTERYTLSKSDWDDESSQSVVVIVHLSGDKGAQAKVTLQAGEQPYVGPKGTEGNPEVIGTAPTKSESKVSRRLVDDGLYYFNFTALAKGTTYRFWTTGGTEDNSLSVAITSDEELASPTVEGYTGGGQGAYDHGIVAKVNAKGLHIVDVSGMEEGGNFVLHYSIVGGRKVEDHPSTDLGKITSTETQAACSPGKRKDSSFTDDIIDKELYKVTLTKGKYYAFWTDGAKADLVMELYDSSGDVLVSNRRGFAEGKDCKLVYKAAASTTYWVGVCQADAAASASTKCTFRAQQLSKSGDAWDFGDDAYTGATELLPALGTKTWKSGEASGPHTLGDCDWTDCYSIACRKGCTYYIGAKLRDAEDKSAAAFKLKGVVYTFVSGKKKSVATIADLAAGGSFTADYNGTYYVEASVDGGQGVCYGPHDVSASVYRKDSDFGFLDVAVGGATASDGAGWYLKADDPKVVYAPGKVALPTGSYTVYFSPIEGWSTPASKKVTISKGETCVLAKSYSDVYDPGDDRRTGKSDDGKITYKAVKITPSEKVKSEKRSLWASDEADWMQFKTVGNAYYSFQLKGDASRLGDATVTIYRNKGKDIVAKGRDFTFLCREDAATYYAVVTHENAEEPADGQYELAFSYKNVGAVGFVKTDYSVKDNAEYVSVKVARTGGTTGQVSVRYHTKEGSGRDAALPGEDYEPLKGELTWKDGESDTKTLKVKLLPKLRKEWKGDRAFSVVLEAPDVDPTTLAEGVYLPIIASSLAELTVVDSASPAVGTVQFAGTSDEFSDKPTSTKSTASVKAGQRLRLWLKRTGGSQGAVGVTVTTGNSKDTAKGGVNYEKISKEPVRWEDGQSEMQYVLLETTDLETEVQETKKLTVKVAVDKTCPSVAKLGSSDKLTISIVDPKPRTFASFKSECAKLDGLSVSATGVWYFNEDGELANATPAKGKSATLKLSLTGPGVFRITPQVSDGGSTQNVLSYTVDKAKAKKITRGGSEIALALGSGAHTVVFTAARATKTVAGDVAFAFDAQEGLPFAWTPLRKPELVAPLSSETVNPACTLRWSDCGDVRYRLNVATSKDKLGAKKTLVRNKMISESEFVFLKCGCDAEELEYGTKYYWRVDSVLTCDDGKELVATGSAWSFNTAAETKAGAGSVATAFKSGAKDAYGEPIAAPAEAGAPVEVKLVQGVDASLSLAVSNATSGATVTYALVSDKYPLPSGLKLSSNGAITGWPTKAGSTVTLLQAKQKKSSKTTKAETLKVKFVVDSLGLASGTFSGLVVTEDESVAGGVDNGLAALTFGSISVTSPSSFKAKGSKGYDKNLTAKVVLGGKSHTFAAPSWTRVDPLLGNGEPGVVLSLSEVAKVAYKDGKKSKTVTNRLELVTSCAANSVQEALDSPMSVKLTLSVANAKDTGVVRDVKWAGQALRDNADVSSVLSAIKKFAGYYTVSLAPAETVSGVEGNGYLTATVSSKGTVKIAGLLADGSTKISASAAAGLISAEVAADGADELLVPVFKSTATQAFGGWLRLKHDGTADWTSLGLPSKVAVVAATSSDSFCELPLTWIFTESAKTASGEGFVLPVEPIGGYYDTTMNLQRYYYDLGRGLAIPSEGLQAFGNEFLEYALGDDEYFIGYPGMKKDGNDERTDIALVGDEATVSAQKLKYRSDNKKMVDWFKSTNPCNLKFEFTRATGIYSGSFELWKGNSDEAGGESSQAKMKTCKFNGVLLFSRDPSSAVLEQDNVAPGSFYATVKVSDYDGKTRSVAVNAPLEIRAVEKTEAWQESGWTESFERIVEE